MVGAFPAVETGDWSVLICTSCVWRLDYHMNLLMAVYYGGVCLSVAPIIRPATSYWLYQPKISVSIIGNFTECISATKI